MKRANSRDLPTFLQKTYSILSDETAPNVFGWTKDGEAFYIKDVKTFEQCILPKYFKHNKFTSFVRQLNTYDFHKVKRPALGQVFRHCQFQRGKPDMMRNIQRKIGAVEEDLEFVDPPSRKWLAVEMRRLERKQIDLQGTVESMEKHSLDIMTKNNTMLNQIIYYKERETRIEKLLVMFASYIQGLHKRKDIDPGLGEFLAFFRKPQEQMFFHDSAPYKRAKPELPRSEEMFDDTSVRSDEDQLDLLLRP